MGKKKLRHPTPITRFLSSFQAIQFLDIQLADGEGKNWDFIYYSNTLFTSLTLIKTI